MRLEENPIYIEDIEKIADQSFPWEKLENKTFLISGSTGMIPCSAVSQCVCAHGGLFYRAARQFFRGGAAGDDCADVHRRVARFHRRRYQDDHIFHTACRHSFGSNQSLRKGIPLFPAEGSLPQVGGHHVDRAACRARRHAALHTG